MSESNERLKTTEDRISGKMDVRKSENSSRLKATEDRIPGKTDVRKTCKQRKT